MALLAQVQFLQILLRIGGSKGRVGLFRLADAIGMCSSERDGFLASARSPVLTSECWQGGSILNFR